MKASSLLRLLKKAIPVLLVGAVLLGRKKKAKKSLPFVKKASKRENVLQWLEPVRAAVARHPGATVPLVLGVMQLESGGNPNTMNFDKAGNPFAQGLMQLIPITQKGLGVTDPLDPEQSIEGGTKLLASNMNRYHGSVEYALAAYNQGPKYIDPLYEKGAPLVFQRKNKKGELITKDVRPYVAIVLANMAAYKDYK